MKLHHMVWLCGSLVICIVLLGLGHIAFQDYKEAKAKLTASQKPAPGIGGSAVTSTVPFQGDGSVIVSPMGTTALPYEAPAVTAGATTAPLKLDSRDWTVTGVHVEKNHDLLATPAEIAELRRVAAKLKLHYTIDCSQSSEDFFGFAWHDGAPPSYKMLYIEDGGKPGWWSGDWPTQSAAVNALTQLIQQAPNDLPEHRPAPKPEHPHQCPTPITGFLLTHKGEMTNV